MNNKYIYIEYEDFKNLLRQFAEEYYNDKKGAALSAKDFAHKLRDTADLFKDKETIRKEVYE